MNHRDWYRITKGVLVNPRGFWENVDTEDKKHSTVYLVVTVLVHSVVVSGVLGVVVFIVPALGASDGAEVLGYKMGSVGMIGLILLGILGFVMSYTMFAFFFVAVPQFVVSAFTYVIVSAFGDTSRSFDASYQVVSYATA
ncbi:MAG: hypothetical protein SXQ77_13790, partial [Halobacteria archaeon]|nr:hypothetical protein [Halobacteria archaeon]